FTFGANLLHLVHTPHLYGQTWDAAVDWQFGSFTPRQAQRVLTVTPGITGWSYGTPGPARSGGLVVPALGVAGRRGRGRASAEVAVVLAVLGLAVLAQFIVLSGRRRRRDFAILRTLGLAGRQVRVITAWQVSTMTGLALAVGIPLGVVAGHWSWRLFAEGLGI